MNATATTQDAISVIFQQAFGINALAGTVLTLVFLPAMYAIWFRIERNPREERSGAAT